MKIGVIGAGYVGLVTSACFAEIGHKVICHDSDETKMDILQKGEVPIYEPYLEELIQKNRKAHRLSFAREFEDAVKPSEARSGLYLCGDPTPRKWRCGSLCGGNGFEGDCKSF